jgi:hypothetical protein
MAILFVEIDSVRSLSLQQQFFPALSLAFHAAALQPVEAAPPEDE